MAGQSSDRVILERLGTRTCDGPRGHPPKSVIRVGDGAAHERAAFLLRLQGTERADRDISVLRRAVAVSHRHQAREIRIIGKAGVRRNIDGVQIRNSGKLIIFRVAVLFRLSKRVDDRFEAARRVFVPVDDWRAIGILLRDESALRVVTPPCGVAFGVGQVDQLVDAVVPELYWVAEWITRRDEATVGIVGVGPHPAQAVLE